MHLRDWKHLKLVNLILFMKILQKFGQDLIKANHLIAEQKSKRN